MTVKIVTDSSNTMEKNLAEELGVTIVPLTTLIDGVVYSDFDIKEGQFLELMRASKALPKTSQPPVGLFAEVFSDLAKDGSQIIAIHLSHALSGTVEAARQGAILSGADVTVVDSGFTDQATKFQVFQAARMAKDGATKDEILSAIEEVKEKTELFIGVSTLDNLVKGGRISRVTGLISSLLNIRLVMIMKNHLLEPVAKGRGNKTFKKWFDDFIANLAGKNVAEIGISFAGSANYAQEMRERLQPLVPAPISVLETSSIIQTHTGEDAWAILVRYE